MSREPGRLLKAESARSLGARIAFNFDDLRRQCDDYLERAREQARTLLEEAQRDADALRADARREGAAAGRAEGMASASAEIERLSSARAEQLLAERLKTALPAVSDAAGALVRERDRWLARWEQTAIELAAAIAKKLIHRELDLSPDLARPMIAETLRLAAGNARIIVRLHPDDVALLGPHAEGIVRQLSACAEAQLVACEETSRGGCHIETEYGAVDGRLETQLQRIVDELVS